MDKLRRQLTSISTKQQFGEVVALVLIVGLMGLLVYLMIPTHTAAPKVAPVTVRSNVSYAMQHQAADSTFRTPATNSNVAQASAVPSGGITSHFTASKQHAVPNNVSHASSIKYATQTPQIAQVVPNARARVSTACTNVTKPIDTTLVKVGNTLHLSSLVSGLVPDTSSCQS